MIHLNYLFFSLGIPFSRFSLSLSLSLSVSLSFYLFFFCLFRLKFSSHPPSCETVWETSRRYRAIYNNGFSIVCRLVHVEINAKIYMYVCIYVYEHLVELIIRVNRAIRFSWPCPACICINRRRITAERRSCGSSCETTPLAEQYPCP